MARVLTTHRDDEDQVRPGIPDEQPQELLRVRIMIPTTVSNFII